MDPPISCIWFRGLTAVKREKFAGAKQSTLQSQGCHFKNSAFWKLQKTVAKHRRLELSTKRGYGTKRDSSLSFMKSQGILTKTVSEV